MPIVMCVEVKGQDAERDRHHGDFPSHTLIFNNPVERARSEPEGIGGLRSGWTRSVLDGIQSSRAPHSKTWLPFGAHNPPLTFWSARCCAAVCRSCAAMKQDRSFVEYHS